VAGEHSFLFSCFFESRPFFFFFFWGGHLILNLVFIPSPLVTSSSSPHASHVPPSATVVVVRSPVQSAPNLAGRECAIVCFRLLRTLLRSLSFFFLFSSQLEDWDFFGECSYVHSNIFPSPTFQPSSRLGRFALIERFSLPPLSLRFFFSYSPWPAQTTRTPPNKPGVNCSSLFFLSNFFFRLRIPNFCLFPLKLFLKRGTYCVSSLSQAPSSLPVSSIDAQELPSSFSLQSCLQIPSPVPPFFFPQSLSGLGPRYV